MSIDITKGITVTVDGLDQDILITMAGGTSIATPNVDDYVLVEAAPAYQGSYEVTPKTTEQTLPTTGKSLWDDVTVHKIPYYETSNVSGTTVYIANEV